MLVRVYQSMGPTDAFLVRDWLERNGLVAVVKGQHLVSLHGEVPANWPSVWVHAEDRALAEQAVKEFEGPALVHPDRACPRCGEANPPAFASCWKCEAEIGL